MSVETHTKTSVSLEGSQPIRPGGNKLTDGPQPENINNKNRCPICGADFISTQHYKRHAHDEHKVGTSTSTAIY